MRVLFLKNTKSLKLFKLFNSKKLSKNEAFFKHKITSITSFPPKNLDIYFAVFNYKIKSNITLSQQKINFERLEFLGDSVLGVIISEYIYIKFSDKNEGFLSQTRSKIVNRNTLNEIGFKLDLVELLVKEKNQSLNKNISGNMLEALIGALYLDRGLKDATNFVLNKMTVLDNYINELESKIISYRGYLLEWAHKQKREFIFNVYEEDNALKEKIFVCEILENNIIISKGREISKKLAIEKASKRAFYSIKNN